jgi:HK97 family phage major capsid protein
MEKKEILDALQAELKEFKTQLPDNSEQIKALEVKIEELSKIDNSELQKEFDAYKAETQKSIEEQGLEMAKMKATSVDAKVKTIQDVVAENEEGIKSSIENKGTEHSFNVKADYLRAGVTNSTQAVRLDSIGQLAHRKLSLYDVFDKVPVGAGSNGVIRYADWDSASITRAAAMVAEGASFPESTAVFAEYSLDLKKIGDTIPMSEEVLQDTPRFAAELNNFLNVNIAIVEDTELYSGAGTTTHMKGVYTSAGEYVAAASGIVGATIYDLIVKMSESMTAAAGSKYMPDFALMNIIDINKMRLSKDDNKNYIMPPFVTVDGTEVAGIKIIESNAVTADTMVIGDSRYGKIYEVEGYNVSTGYTDTQFAEDLVTLKAKKREALLIRTADEGGFKKETGIAAALVTLAS